MEIKDLKKGYYFSGVGLSSKGKIKGLEGDEKEKEEIKLIQKQGVAHLLNQHLLTSDQEAASLKDRLVLLLITIDSLYASDQDGIYFINEFNKITNDIHDYINNMLLNSEVQEIVGKFEDFKIEPNEKDVSIPDRLKSIAKSMKIKLEPYALNIQTIFNKYNVIPELDQKELEALNQVKIHVEYESLRNKNISIITTSNYNYHLIKNSLQKLTDRLEGVESFISLFATYELPQLYQFLKEKIHSKKEWSINEKEIQNYETDKLDSTTKQMIEKNQKMRQSLIQKAYDLLNNITSKKEMVSITNILATTIINPRQTDAIDHHQTCLDNLTHNKFIQHFSDHEKYVVEANLLFEKINEYLNSLNETLNVLKKEKPNEEIMKKAQNFNVDPQEIKNQNACYEKHRQLCMTEIAFINRFVELIKYRLEGTSLPSKFTNYVSARTHNGSLMGQLQKLGNRTYLKGDTKGQMMMGNNKFKLLNQQTSTEEIIVAQENEILSPKTTEEILVKKEERVSPPKITQETIVNKKETSPTEDQKDPKDFPRLKTKKNQKKYNQVRDKILLPN